MNKSIKTILITIITVFILSGCDTGSSSFSIEERISAFIDDCDSTDKSDMYNHLHPTETEMRDQMRDSSTWSDFSAADAPWSITITSQTGSSEITVYATIDHVNISEQTITIVFKEGDEDDVWYIKTFEWPASNVDIY